MIKVDIIKDNLEIQGSTPVILTEISKVLQELYDNGDKVDRKTIMQAYEGILRPDLNLKEKIKLTFNKVGEEIEKSPNEEIKQFAKKICKTIIDENDEDDEDDEDDENDENEIDMEIEIDDEENKIKCISGTLSKRRFQKIIDILNEDD